MAGSVAMAEDLRFSGYTTYGTPGIIDMPHAWSRPDAELSFTTSTFADHTRNTLTFQITPRLSGSFRYALLYDIRPDPEGSEVPFLFDRSFSLHYRIADETETRPAIAVGLNDFLGTGVYSSEYFVASKHVGDRLRVSGGIGWGRLAGIGGFDNPFAIFGEQFETREDVVSNGGGQVSTGQFFTGDAAFFGGLEYRATDRLTLMAEYSSDAYPSEDGAAFDRRSPINVGLSYDLSDNVTLSGHYLYGSEVGAMITVGLNPLEPPRGAGIGNAPRPVSPRADAPAGLAAFPDATRARTEITLADEGIRLHGWRMTGDTVFVEIENLTFPRTAQAIGRTARILTATAPVQIDVFVITPVVNGLRGTSATIRRDDLTSLAFDLDQSWSSYTRAIFDDTPAPLPVIDGRYPLMDYGWEPYLATSLFDPDDPLRADAGIALYARYEPAPGLIFSGSIRQKVFGNRDESTRDSTSVLPKVRSDFNIYEREGETALTTLTAARYFEVAPRIDGRVTVGYLEPMFGGLSAELLWTPEQSPFSYGVEVNHVRQRDFDQLLGFRDYEVTTGHASVYWDMGNGFHSQLDVGRYLAGDWGATFTLDREFENGWRIGAFATLTDVPFEDFGEGSFDKGLRITVPIGWISGEATTENFTQTIRPVTRDGGARLNVEGRLYDLTRDQSQDEYRQSWGRFWR